FRPSENGPRRRGRPRGGRCKWGRMCRRTARCGAPAAAPGKRRVFPAARCSTVLTLAGAASALSLRLSRNTGRRGRDASFAFEWFLQTRYFLCDFLRRLGRRQAIESVGHGPRQLRDALAGGGRDGVEFESAPGAKLAETFDARSVR